MKVVENILKISIPNTQEEYKIMEDMWVKKYKVTAGTRVKVLKKVPSNSNGWNNTWPTEMNYTVDREYEVERVWDGYGCRGISLSCGFAYPFFVLEVIDE